MSAPAADVVELVAAVFGVVFIGAAIAKVDAFKSWGALVAKFPVAPPFRQAIRFTLPVVEMAVGVAVLIAPRVGLAVCGFVFATFAVVLFVFLPQLRGSDCQCFGAVAPARIDLRLVLRNLVLGAVAVGTSAFSWTLRSLGHVPALEFAAIALAAVLAILLANYRALPKLDHVGELSPPKGGP